MKQQRGIIKRSLAWTLIAALVNPAASVPAWAQVPPNSSTGDFVIYTSTSSSGASEPNILLLIDTSDSMNIPEAWREYDDTTYDSHVEYLWNSPGYINRISTSDPAGGLSTAGSSVNYFVYNGNSNASANSRTMRYDAGWTAGATAADRGNLRLAALAYAGGTQSGDPGARSIYRKYAWSNDGGTASSWQSSHTYIYWVPLEGRDPSDPAIEADPRLRSNSLNKFPGAAAVTTYGNTNPSGNPVTRGGIMFGQVAGINWIDPWNNASDFNQCAASFAELTPSTVYAPSTASRNAGKMLNQKWQRWEKWRALDTSRVASYPGSDTTSSCSATGGSCTQGYLDGYRDANPGTDNPGLAANTGNDTRRILPVVTRIDAGNDNVVQAGDSHAGWGNLRADLGGANRMYNSLSEISNDATGTTYLKSMLNAQPAPLSTANPASKAAGVIDLHKNITPGEYYDTATTVTAGAAAYNLRKVRFCARSGGSSVTDARGTTRTTGGSCNASPADGDTDCNNSTGSCRCQRQSDSAYVDDANCASLADPPACGLAAGDTFYTRDNDSCAWSGRASFVSKDYNGCQWYGRQTTVIENVGTYYHGGQCRGACSGPDCEAAVNGGENYCTKSTSGNITISGTTYYDYRTDTATAGCSNKSDGPTYWHGGFCLGRYRTSPPYSGPGWTNSPAGADDATTCSASVEWPSLVVGGTTYYKVRDDSGGCSTNGDVSSGCTPIAGLGAACTTCGDATTAWTPVGGGGSNYTVYNRTMGGLLTHDCKADDGAIVMRNPASNPSQFGTTWNSNSTPGNNNHSYSNNSGHAIPGAPIPDINLYSVNYLNWKYGAKACRNAAGDLITATASLPSAVSCKPLGRKTRLQIAKDALSDLVATTNGVRFGLMVFNKMGNMASGFSSEGANLAYKITTMGPKNCSLASPTTTASMTTGSAVLTLASNPGFGVGNAITVPGAGTAGGNLNATILSVTGTTLILSTAAVTTVSGVTVAVPACDAGELTAYANRSTLVAKINSLVAAARTPLTESLYEAYRYFRGEAPVFGRLTTTANAGGTVAAGCDKTAFVTPGGGADCTGSSGNYVSPMATSVDPNTGLPAACQKNFVVLMTDGGPEDDFTANAAVKALADSSAAGTVSPDTQVDQTQTDTASRQFEDAGLPYGPTDLSGTANDGGYIWLDELAYYMSAADMNTSITGRQPVVTYTIGFAGANTPVLQQAATRSGGNNYVANDSDELAAALTAAVAAIREWNPTASAPTVPLSALNRSESGEQVYLAFFGPSNSQAWSGTVKQFRFGEGETQCGRTSVPDAPIDLCLVGKTVLSGATVKNIEKIEIDPITAEQNVVVNPAAVSFWNPTDMQDGSKPNLGGSGQRLKDDGVWNPSTRKVYTIITDPGAASEAVSSSASILDSSNTVEETNTSLMTKSRLGSPAMSDATRSTLINFVRGGNPSDANCSDASSGTACTAWNTWPHFDVLHSRPALVTYDPTPVADPEVGGGQLASAQYLFFLTNEGLLRAVDAKTGAEKWSFLVEEAISRIVDVKNNLSGQHLTLADGAPSVWVHDANGNGIIGDAAGEKAWLYFGLRRGGRVYYALDVTNINSPSLMWKITPTQRCLGLSCTPTADFAEMGYTWSTPSVGRLRAIGDLTIPGLVIGGGHDANQDNATVSSADTMGRGVFVLRGDNANLLRAFTHADTAGMDFSIPSDVAALNTDLDSQSLLDRAYVGDMAANVWRFDINNSNPAAWTAKQLAALSDPFALPGTAPNRKILFPPVVVKQNFLGQRYDAVYIGTGDREHPLNPASADKMFMIKDTGISLAASADPVITYPGSLLDITNSFTETDFTTLLGGAAWSSKTGWYFSFASGEKLTSSPTVFRNILSFSTYSPNLSISACVPPGKGVLYGMSALDGSVVAGTYAAGAGVTAQQRRQYVGLSVRGYIPTGSLIVRGKKVFVVNVADGRLLYKQIGTIGGASKVYWYRESER